MHPVAKFANRPPEAGPNAITNRFVVSRQLLSRAFEHEAILISACLLDRHDSRSTSKYLEPWAIACLSYAASCTLQCESN